MTDTRTPAERRGYPLPPWTAEARYPSGAEVLDWLLDLLEAYPQTEDGVAQATAYLDAITTARADAQAAASRCHVADHEGAVAQLADLERRLAELRARYRDLEELYAALPPVRVATDLEADDELGVDVLTVRLAFALGTHVLDDEARGRIAEAAGVAVFQAYEREHTAATVVDVTTLADTEPRYEVVDRARP